MDDLISRQSVLNTFLYFNESERLEIIKKLPSAQPEIIRCKDCLFSTCIEEQDDWWECEHDHRVNHGDGFCNWSEEKKNEDR